MRRRLGVALVLAMAVVLVAGCGAGSSSFPTGKWTATNSAGEVAVMEYRSDGTWAFTGAGTPISSGTYSADASTIKFVTDSYCKAAGNEQATYTWTHANDQLTLEKQTDLCADRVGVLDGMAWKPAPLPTGS
jgi:hypothetical protein